MRPFLLLVVLLFFTVSGLAQTSAEALVAAARKQVGVTLQYDPAYVVLAYPGGDVPMDRGVCTDVVIRAYRMLGFDLQKQIHEDMKGNFRAYPQMWGLGKTDANIDHRRVPNLRRFFERQDCSLSVSQKAEDYRPGDLVTCIVPPNLPHIMVVSDAFSSTDPKRRLVIHNIGHGAKEEDALLVFQLTGHYRWHPEKRAN